MEELHRIGGTVADEDGTPLAGTWIALPDAGRWAASDHNGRFQFARVPAGKHQVVARTIEGHEAKATVSVPGGQCDLVPAPPRRRTAKS